MCHYSADELTKKQKLAIQLITSETAADVTHVMLVSRITVAAKKPVVVIHGPVIGSHYFALLSFLPVTSISASRMTYFCGS